MVSILGSIANWGRSVAVAPSFGVSPALAGVAAGSGYSASALSAGYGGPMGIKTGVFASPDAGFATAGTFVRGNSSPAQPSGPVVDTAARLSRAEWGVLWSAPISVAWMIGNGELFAGLGVGVYDQIAGGIHIGLSGFFLLLSPFFVEAVRGSGERESD